MQQKYFLNPFAEAGDKTAVPDALDPSGFVSYEQGYGFDYERNNDGSDPLAKNIERQKMNELFFDITSNIQQYQQNGVPEFITSANNGGTPYSYSIDAKVRYDDSGTGANWRVYRSKANTNIALPTDTTKWELAEYAPLAPNYTGVMGTITAAGTTNIGAATSDYLNVTGTTTITAFDTVAAGVERTLKFADALTLTHNATSLILPTGANITTVAGDVAEFKSEGSGNWRLVGGTIYARVSGASTGGITGVRQTVQSGRVDGTTGAANFIEAGTGLSVVIKATAVPIVVHAAGGAISNDRKGTLSADTTISSLPANSTVYFYADVNTDNTFTVTHNTVAHVEKMGGAPATTNNLLTFNIGETKSYLGNGTTASQAYRVPLGECVTGASTVTSVTTYALNGLYTYKQAVVPNTAYNFNHNIGTTFLKKQIDFVFNRTIGQMVSGDIMLNINTIENSSLGNNKYEGKTTKTTYLLSTQMSAVLYWVSSSAANATETSGHYIVTMKRSY